MPVPQNEVMATTTETLVRITSAAERNPRPAQSEAAALLDESTDLHHAMLMPTGSGKSLLAIAASLGHGGGVVAMHSNGLISQYMAEAAEWEEATGTKIVALVGKGHYWCPTASPSLVGLTDKQRAFVTEHGHFLGAGLEQRDYKHHTVLSLDPVKDEDEDDDAAKKSPCDSCSRKTIDCPLWAARNAAATADVVITNATMLGLALGGSVKWAADIVKPLVVLDEAHADIDPIAEVLGRQITIRGDRFEEAAAGLVEALSVVKEWADDEDHPNRKQARRFLAARKIAIEEGRRVVFTAEADKVLLTIPADLKALFRDMKVLAMSATLSQRNVDALGLSTTLRTFTGLDVSASTVFVDEDAPRWAFGKADPAQHRAWAAHLGALLTEKFRAGGATLALFQSKDDLHAVVSHLPADVAAGVLHYYSGVDRVKTIETYKRNPKAHMIVGCVSGAGTGVNLPGDLLRTVVVARVPQNPPKGAGDKAAWLEDTRAAVVQSVGRAHRFDGDWGHVHVVGGFGHRSDIRKNLEELGWVIK